MEQLERHEIDLMNREKRDLDFTERLKEFKEDKVVELSEVLKQNSDILGAVEECCVFDGQDVDDSDVCDIIRESVISELPYLLTTEQIAKNISILLNAGDRICVFKGLIEPSFSVHFLKNLDGEYEVFEFNSTATFSDVVTKMSKYKNDRLY